MPHHGAGPGPDLAYALIAADLVGELSGPMRALVARLIPFWSIEW